MPNLVTSLLNSRVLALIAGLAAGVAVILLIRAGQMWRSRRSYGYSVYEADEHRRRLLSLGGAGVVLALVAGAVYAYWLARPPGGQQAATAVQAEGAASIEGMELVIPKLAVETSLIDAPVVAQQWDVSRLRYEVAHLEGTALPGHAGNAVLAGHITVPGAGWGPFQELDQLQAGDRLFITQGDVTYTYEVTESKVVARSAVEVAYPTPDARLTLITCTGWDDNLNDYADRIIVVAMPIPGQ